jgi:branched-chain amino acid transport system permease protein
MALCFVVGTAIGFPALRVKGLYLALLTLGMAALFPDLARRFVRGVGGTQLVRPPSASLTRPEWADFFKDYATETDQWHYYVTLVFAALMLLVMWGLVRARFGRALIAVRDHEAAAATVGINPARVKVSAFAISALFAGLAGSLSVQVATVANADAAETFRLSIEFLVAVVIGGTATVLGPLLGAVVVVFLDDYTGDLISGKEVLSPAIFGVVLIVLMYFLPDGVVGGTRRFLASSARVFRRRRLQSSTP